MYQLGLISKYSAPLNVHDYSFDQLYKQTLPGSLVINKEGAGAPLIVQETGSSDFRRKVTTRTSL